jgi:serine/threonine protein kinase
LALIGLFHCDIKPANIMINKNKDIFLIDIDSFSKGNGSYITMSDPYAPRKIFIKDYY